jgi:hypothetical protein
MTKEELDIYIDGMTEGMNSLLDFISEIEYEVEEGSNPPIQQIIKAIKVFAENEPKLQEFLRAQNG